jgi:hypothetical protein
MCVPGPTTQACQCSFNNHPTAYREIAVTAFRAMMERMAEPILPGIAFADSVAQGD